MPAARHAREQWKESTAEASAAFCKHRYEEAERRLKEALPLVLDQGPATIAAVLEDLAAVYIETHRYEAAKLLLAKTVGILENAGQQRDTDALLAVIGLRYEQMGLYEEALRLCKKRQALLRQSNEPEAVVSYLVKEIDEELERIRRDKHEQDLLMEKLSQMLETVPVQLPEVQMERTTTDSSSAKPEESQSQERPQAS